MNLQQLYTIAIGHHQSGQFLDAIIYYQQILQQSPEIHDVRTNMAAAQLSSGDYDAAEKNLNLVLKAVPEHIDARINLGNLQSNLGNYKKSLQQFQLALKKAPKRADIAFNIALVYQEKSDLIAAENWYEKTLKIDPTFVQAQVNLALVRLQKGNTASAKKALEDCISKFPTHPEALLNLGHIYSDEGDIERAESNYRKAYEAAPKLAHTRNALLRMLLEKEHIKEAIEILEKDSINDVDGLILQGNAYQQSGDTVQAMASYEAVLEKEPKHIGVRRNLAKLLQQKIPGWHFNMLADEARNQAYDNALQKAIRSGDKVLDIGTGSGLLAMMAIRAGASRVDACEMVPELAQTAEKIIAQNHYSSQINVIADKSVNVKIGEQMPEKADLLVSEILDAGLLGEGVLPSVRHAKKQLLKENAIIIPQAATLKGMLVDLPKRKLVNPIKQISGFDLSYFDRFRSPGLYNTIHLKNEIYHSLTDVTALTTIDFQDIPPALSDNEAESYSIPLTIKHSGEANAFVFWFDLRVFEDIEVSSSPDGEMKHWGQAVYYFEDVKKVQTGEQLTIQMLRNDMMIQFTW